MMQVKRRRSIPWLVAMATLTLAAPGRSELPEWYRVPTRSAQHYVLELSHIDLFEIDVAQLVARCSEQLARTAPDQRLRLAELYQCRGDAHYVSDNFPAAQRDYEAALEIIPNDPDLRCALARVRLAIGDKQAAFQLCRDALQSDPRFGTALALISIMHSDGGDSKSAILAADQAVAAAPTDPIPYLARGIAFVHAENYEAALKDLDHYVLSRPLGGSNPPLPYFLKAKALAGLDRIPEAVTQLQMALRLDRDYYPAHRILWFAYYKSEDFTLGRLTADEMLRLAPDNTETLRAVATMRFLTSDYRAAEQFARKWLADEPASSKARAILAASLAALGRHGDAKEHYRAILADNATYEEKLVVASFLATYPQRSQADIEQAQRIIDSIADEIDRRSSGNGRYVQAVVLASSGRFEEATNLVSGQLEGPNLSRRDRAVYRILLNSLKMRELPTQFLIPPV